MLGWGALSETAISEAPGSGGPGTPLALAGLAVAGVSVAPGIIIATGVVPLYGRSATGASAVAPLASGLPLQGLAQAGATAPSSLASGTPGRLSASKLIAYAALTPYVPRLSASKLVAYAVTTPLQSRISATKLIAYAATTPLQGKLSVTKLIAYGAVYALTPNPIEFPSIPVGFPVTVKPTFANVMGSIPSGRDMRAQQQVLPVWDFKMTFEILRDQTQNASPFAPLAGFTEFMELVEVFLAGIGEFGQFVFDAWWDDSRTDQAIATGDGVSGNFTMVRTWGFGALQFTEPVGVVNVITNVKVNGVVQSPSTYFIQKNNILTFLTAPASGATITSTFSYFYLCQMSQPQQTYEEFMKDRWTAKIQFRSIVQH